MSPRGARKMLGSSPRRRLWKLPSIPLPPKVSLPPILPKPKVTIPFHPKLPPVNLPPIPKVPIPFHPKLPPVHLPPIPKLPPLPDLPRPHIPKLSFGLPFLNLHIIGTVLVSIGVLFLLAILAGVACCCCTNFRKKKMAGQREAVDVEDRVHVHKTVVPGSHRQQSAAAPSVHEVIEEGKGINEASRSEPYTSEKGMSEQRTVAPS
ncbi:hypothetical protein C4D60_Mb05t27480 [Musa balbisiana]|uniref:Uncharacterized protein n=1 Tax=Musa balbisiana TaxID=52838 RepID=A0A4S8JZ82_MUSBA|nr:hypothetical protein C4D60_Mb05t27480 [Musa balbisiana]